MSNIQTIKTFIASSSLLAILKQHRLKVALGAFLLVVGVILLATHSVSIESASVHSSRSFNAYGYDEPGFDSYGQRTAGPSRLVQHSLSFGIGLILGLFFSYRLRKFRKWLLLCLLALGSLYVAYANEYAGNGVSFLAGGWLGLYLLREKIKQIVEEQRKKPRPTLFGSAEWASFAHLCESKLIGSSGLFLGEYRDPLAGQKHPIHYPGNRHLLTIAPTRSGKGVSAVIPNLLTYTGSALVIDPKGENAMITGARRGSGDEAQGIPGMGQKIHVVDPWGITGMQLSRFNPLDWLQAKDDDITENAMMLADAIVLPREGSSDPFWDEEAKALLMGLILYVALDESEAENRDLGRVRDIITMGIPDFRDILLKMSASGNPVVRSTAQRTASKEEKLLSNVMASLQSHTHFLDSPRLRESLSRSDFRFEDLKAKPMTVYLVLPADRLKTFDRWLRLLVQQAITVNARNIAVKPEKPVLFMLDEMPALGRLKMVEQAFSLMAGFGMQLWGIVQDFSQLERIYDKGWETFIGNSGVLQYFGSRDCKTADYFSKLCGVTTVEKFSFSNTLAKAWSWFTSSTERGSPSSGSSEGTTRTSGYTQDLAQRQLIYPDELMVLRENKQLLLVENCNPICPDNGRKVVWFEDRGLRGMGVSLR